MNMKEQFGFNNDLAKQVEEKALKKGDIGIEDNYADTENRQTSNLEEEREFRELIPKYESVIQKLDDLESKSIEYRNKQNQYFHDLNSELVDINNTIADYLKILNDYKSKNEKLNYLNKKNLQYHINSGDINPRVTSEKNEMDTLQKEINELSEKIFNENIPQQWMVLHGKYLVLKEKIDSLRDFWYPANPSNN